MRKEESSDTEWITNTHTKYLYLETPEENHFLDGCYGKLQMHIHVILVSKPRLYEIVMFVCEINSDYP